MSMSISMYLDYPLSGASSPPAMPFYVHSSSHTFSPPAGAFVISFFVKNPDFFYSKTRKSYDRIFQNFTSQGGAKRIMGKEKKIHTHTHSTHTYSTTPHTIMHTHTHTHMCTCPPLYLTWRGREAATDIQYKKTKIK